MSGCDGVADNKKAARRCLENELTHIYRVASILLAASIAPTDEAEAFAYLSGQLKEALQAAQDGFCEIVEFDEHRLGYSAGE